MKDTINNNTGRVLLLNAGVEGEAPPIRLKRENIQVTRCAAVDEATGKLNEHTFDLIVICGMNAADLRRTVREIKSGYPWAGILAVVAGEETGSAWDIIEAGAHDCLAADCSSEELAHRIDQALEHSRIKQELTSLRQHVAMSYGFDNIVGISKQITTLKETLHRVSPTDIAVHLFGPVGCGKELAARVIHYHSHRRKGNFVTVDCTTAPEQVLETQLFGDTEGVSLSGKTGPRGLLAEADGGTLFLSDVDRLPASLQPRLVRFLKEPALTTPGRRETTRVDVRVISASSKDLSALVDEGCFSKELFYQLSVLPIQVPGLASRPEDIEMLTEYFLRRAAHEMNRPQFEVTRRALDLLVGHRWPGNVRELENTLKRATALCRENRVDSDDILFITSDTADTEPRPAERPALSGSAGTLDEGQRRIIIKALSENDWNFTQTAQELGIGRTTLWRKVKKYNLRKEKVTA